MIEPDCVVVVHWLDAPPANYWQRISDSEYRNPAAQSSCILWRNRWIAVADAVRDTFDELDRKLASGEWGLLWERG